MKRVRIQQAFGTGAGVWHELDVDDQGRGECPLCRERMPVLVVVEHLQPPRSGTVLPMAGDEPAPDVALRFPDSW